MWEKSIQLWFFVLKSQSEMIFHGTGTINEVPYIALTVKLRSDIYPLSSKELFLQNNGITIIIIITINNLWMVIAC